MSSTRKNGEKREADYYPTPSWCVDLIMKEIHWQPEHLWGEPCRGDGAIYDKIPTRKDWCELRQGRDYLSHQWEQRPVGIITNPPFSIFVQFLTKSLKEAQCVVYLLRINALGAQERCGFWRANEPTHLFIHSERPDFTGEGGDSTEYAWYAWDRIGLIKKRPGIHHLTVKDQNMDLFS